MNQPAQPRPMPNFKDGTRSCAPAVALHPAWRAFIDYCAQLGYGEIATLKIQDGLPVIAEAITRKVKFSAP